MIIKYLMIKLMKIIMKVIKQINLGVILVKMVNLKEEI